jgi:hypothetical protein
MGPPQPEVKEETQVKLRSIGEPILCLRVCGILEPATAWICCHVARVPP